MAFIKRFRHSLKYLLAASCLIFTIVLLWLLVGFYLIKKNYNRHFTQLPIQHDVIISRDDHAIPFIQAQSFKDALFGLGFVHAQDRYWQMMMLREAAKGELSAQFGKAFLKHDRMMHTLDLEGVSKKIYLNQSKKTQEKLIAYAAGVNAWVDANNKQWLPLAPESFIFSTRFAPWQPEDSILVQKFMHYTLTNKAEQSLLTMWLMQQLNHAQLSSLIPGLKQPDNQPWPIIKRTTASQTSHSGASNVFAIAGNQTAHQRSMLGSDPHLEWTAPSQWMLVSMIWGNQIVTGGSVPGMPAVIIGRNSDIAWGLTMTGADDQDLNFIRIDPPLKKQDFQSLTERKVRIPIKQAKTYEETVYVTPQGPVVKADLYGFEMADPAYNNLVLQWTGLDEKDKYFDFQWALMSANSRQAVKNALPNLIAPNTNLAIADQFDVEIMMTGQLPNRHPNHPTQGRYPGDFNDLRTHWQGLQPLSKNPLIKYKQGVVANTNNRVTNQPFPNHVTFNWIDRYRIRRVDEMVNINDDPYDLESMKAFQLDITSYKAKWVNGLLLYHLDKSALSKLQQPLLEQMQLWQGDMVKHRFEPLFYHTWLNAFKKRLFASSEINLENDLDQLNPAFIENLLKDKLIQEQWCGQSCSDMVLQSFNDAFKTLRQRFGDPFTGWQWGRLYQAKHEHPTLGKVPIISLIVNIQHAIGGDDDTLAMAKPTHPDQTPIVPQKGAGLRVIVDFSDAPNTIHMVNSTGQSGHLLSKYYKDQNILWRQGEYIIYNPENTTARYISKLEAN